MLGLLNPIGTAQAQELPPEEPVRRSDEPAETAEPAELRPGEVMRIQRFNAARESLKRIDPDSRAFEFLRAPGAIPSEAEIAQLEGAARDAAIKRTCDFLRPDGKPIGAEGTSPDIRVLSGGLAAAQRDYEYLSLDGTPLPMPNGSRVLLPGGAGYVMLRPTTSTPGSPAIDVNIPNVMRMKMHY